MPTTNRELRRRLIIKNIFNGSASFKFTIFRAIRPVSGKPYMLAKITRSFDSQLETTSLQLIKTHQFIIRPETNILRVIVSKQGSLYYVIYIFI